MKKAVGFSRPDDLERKRGGLNMAVSGGTL